MKKTNRGRALLRKLTGPKALPVLCYVVVVLGWLVVSATNLAVDTMLIHNGTLAPQTLTVDDFELVELEKAGENTVQATGYDPQMILKNVPPVVRSLQMEVTYSSQPNEVDLYYAAAGQPFGDDRRVWAVPQPDGSYLFTLPRKEIASLRLDPASTTIKMKFTSIALNLPQSPANYFNLGWGGLVVLLVLPAFVAAGLRLALNVVQYCLGRGRKFN